MSIWSTVQAHPANNPVELYTKTGDAISFDKLINQIEPLQNKYWYYNKLPLYNGHLQTFAASKKEFDINVLWYGRRVFNWNEALISVDYVIPEDSVADLTYSPLERIPRPFPLHTRYLKPEEIEKLDDSSITKPLLITVHGLAGGAIEPYVRASITALKAAAPEFDHCVITSRGCNRSILGTPQFFNAGWTDDVRQLVKHVSETQPNRPIYLVGYSLGAGIVANYLGQEADKTKIAASCIVAAPWDLNICNVLLENSMMGKHVYSRAMGANVSRLTRHHADMIKDTYPYNVSWGKKGPNTKTIREYDDLFNSLAFGFDSALDYYRHASPVNRLRNIRTPSLVLCARDDPICSDQAVPYQEFKKNGFVHAVSTTVGGHLGWFDNKGGRWNSDVIAAYFKTINDQIDYTKPAKRSPPTKRWWDGDRFQEKPISTNEAKQV